jgi:hypothetical protein
MKVYCKECKWLATNYYYVSGIPGTDRYLCTCPQFTATYDTPLELMLKYGDYKEINKHNDCAGFKAKTKTFMEKLRDEYSGV